MFTKCLLAATCATLGGTIAKYAFSDGTTLIYQIILVPLSIGFNALQLSLFVEFMHEVGSVKATFLIKAVECCFTAMVGYILFKESLSLRWIARTICILIGFYLLQSDSNEDDKKEKDKIS